MNILALSQHWRRFPNTRTNSPSYRRRPPSSTSATNSKLSRRRSSPWKKKIRRYVAFPETHQSLPHLRPQVYIIGKLFLPTIGLKFLSKPKNSSEISTLHPWKIPKIPSISDQTISNWPFNIFFFPNLQSQFTPPSKTKKKIIHLTSIALADNTLEFSLNILKFSTGEKIRKGWLAEKVDRKTLKT